MGKSGFDSSDIRTRYAEAKASSEKPEAFKKPEIFDLLRSLEDQITLWDELKNDYEILTELSGNEKDWAEFEEKLKKAELLLYFTKPHDNCGVVLSLYAGTGGDDAEDFSQMLEKMYLSYSEKKAWQVKIIDRSTSSVGLKSATLEIKGDYAYGFLGCEHGVHRLIRLSPFNSGHTRETSFAKVDVLPLLKSTELKIDPQDLRIDVYRSGGHGGQGVNTTDSAVRITHLPTSLVVTCQTSRSQIQNKALALEVLTARLAKLMETQNAKKLSDLRGEKTEVGFGSQIRTYTLHPYRLVKDHRTNYESTNPDTVFGGDLDPFIFSFLSS